MTNLPPDNPILLALQQRVSTTHLRQRLGIESDYEAQIFGQGRNFVHIENWYSLHSVIRNTLRLLLLYKRGRSNALKIEIHHNDIPIDRLPGPFDGYTILQISDPHLDINPQMAAALIDTLLRVDYDLCVLTGDFRAKTYGPFEPALERMQRVRHHLKDPVYAVLGNHDSIMMVPGLEGMGIRLLLNEFTLLRRGGAEIYLVGVDDPHYYRADNMEKATAGVPQDAPSILLSHTPEIYRHAAHLGFDAMLCGHTHGGQICLPGGIPVMCNARCPREMCSRSWKYHNMVGYTSRGSGVSVVDVRLNCPPEVTLHHLRRA
jgi:predicted MPP superfamily phosphohydrolase